MNTALFYKSLSDETRLKTLILLAFHGDLCVCELMHALQVSQPFISRHLAILRANGLVSDERRGKWVFYHLHHRLPAWARKILAETANSSELEYLRKIPGIGQDCSDNQAADKPELTDTHRQLALI